MVFLLIPCKPELADVLADDEIAEIHGLGEVRGRCRLASRRHPLRWSCRSAEPLGFAPFLSSSRRVARGSSSACRKRSAGTTALQSGSPAMPKLAVTRSPCLK